MKQISEEKIRAYAENAHLASVDLNANWWKKISCYRLKKWKNELKNLSEETGISMSEVNFYIGGDYAEVPGFFRKLPKKRETYIGIGMAYGLPLEKINEWLKKYGMKRQLYIKDVMNDLAWIYLIQINDRTGSENYFMMHEECLKLIKEEYFSDWTCHEIDYIPANILEERMNSVNKAENHSELRRFVKENMDGFASAYMRPRKMLIDRVNMILSERNCNSSGKKLRLNGLRGYLDDSMINYISGGYECINTVDKNGVRTPGIKQMPKNRRAHISMCLALGMTLREIDEYLELMGYSRLDALNCYERQLITDMQKWEEEHPLQRLLKEGLLTRPKDRVLAANEMLMMRSDLKVAYEEGNKGCSFLYLKD